MTPAFTASLTRHAASGCHTADTYALTDSTGAAAGEVLVRGTTHPSTPIASVTLPGVVIMGTPRKVLSAFSRKNRRDVKITAERTAAYLAAVEAVNNLTATAGA